MDFPLTAHWVGRAENVETVGTTAMEAGRIISVDAEDGVEVRKGSLLFTLGGTEIDNRKEIVSGNIASLERRVKLAKKLVDRKWQAVERKISSRDELNAAENTLAALQAELKSNILELRRIRTLVFVRAPITGIFMRRRVSVGQEVEKGEELARLIAPDRMRIVAVLYAPDRVQPAGMETILRNSDGRELSGLVIRVLPERTPAGGAILWIEGEEINRLLKPGEVVSGDILLSTHAGVLAVPESAIVYDQNETPYVFFKGAGGYKRQQVKTGLVSDGWVEIVSGVNEGDSVVVQGAYELFYRDFSKLYKVAD